MANLDNLTDTQCEIWVLAVQLSRNGQNWRFSTLRKELVERDGYAEEDVDIVFARWAEQERGELTPDELQCVRRAFALSRHAAATENNVRFKLAAEGHDEDAIQTAIDICHEHDLFDGRSVNWEPPKP
jgi:hypothetical protein